MRICLFTETALPKIGGQELVVDALARNLTKWGHQVVVLAQRPRWRYRVDDAGLPYRVERFPRMWSTHRLVDWYGYWLTRLYRRWKFDILHCHSVYPCGYLAARARLPAPIVITSHGGDVHAGNARLRKRGLPARFSLALKNADALVAISRYTANAFDQIELAHARVTQIPNGVDLEPLTVAAPRPESIPATVEAGNYALFLGRLRKQKGIDLLIDAVASLARRGTHVPLVIAGAGDEADGLARLVQELKLDRQVTFVGSVAGERKHWLLQNARCVVVPSRGWEAFGIVVIEAYAAGSPVIVSDLPGMIDLIEPQQSGLVVPTENVAALAAALDEVWTNRSLAEALAARGRQLAQQYTWPAVVARHEQLYRQLLAGSRTLAA